ncbi:MAG: ribosome small subunit-dependent GTPase A [Clostridia bacterium]|nr:ribosome small subunit-dependent GTPase A [Clostridia bacterium]
MRGIIVGNISNQYLIQTQDKKVYEAVARGKFKINEITPVVGDKVEIDILDENKNTAVITKIFDRTKYIKRPKLANLTKLVFVISSRNPKPDLLMLDKQLVFAEFLGIDAIIVINKTDLEKKENIEAIKEIYENIGYKVITTNAKQRQGIDELKNELTNNISAFSGNSGVGKSTLLNAIFEKDVTQEGQISIKNKKGKNTTTAIRLYEIEEDTYIADTPGFSVFDIYEIETRDLYKYFREFKVYEKSCEFVGCTHIKEKECGIRKALEEGNISNSRYQNYIKIYEDLKDREEHKW